MEREAWSRFIHKGIIHVWVTDVHKDRRCGTCVCIGKDFRMFIGHSYYVFNFIFPQIFWKFSCVYLMKWFSHNSMNVLDRCCSTWNKQAWRCMLQERYSWGTWQSWNPRSRGEGMGEVERWGQRAEVPTYNEYILKTLCTPGLPHSRSCGIHLTSSK